MLDIRLAKSRMENEEGMNHVWIHIPPLPVKYAHIQVYMPDGIGRAENLTGYFENEAGMILLGTAAKGQDILLEIYTSNPVPCGEYPLTISLYYEDARGRQKEVTHSLPLVLVAEEEMEDVLIDQGVVDQLKRLHDIQRQDDCIVMQPKTYEISSELAELEKKYRIDCRESMA
ncbi:hypothetical protein [Aneurinibacillus sp. REN35]|uniref:hypothetical protein n=1 Tax=Aneurinibacillus sp. REN35 TaxID=3237286 RepID=UPI003528F2FC